MLRCPECQVHIQVNLPSDSRIVDMADLSRQNRIAGGFGVVKCEGCGYEGDPLEFDPRSLLPKIVSCYVDKRGKVAGFDAGGNRVAECQGFLLEVAQELKIRCDEKTRFMFSGPEVDLSWWFRAE